MRYARLGLARGVPAPIKAALAHLVTEVQRQRASLHVEARSKTVDALERWGLGLDEASPQGQAVLAPEAIARVQKLLRGMPSNDLRLEATAEVCRACGSVYGPACSCKS